jgi:Phage tail assembly chaperone proteins, E, or 41 or 14
MSKTVETAAPTGKTKIVFKLVYPVQYQGETINDVTYRRPNGGDMRKYANGKGGYGTDLTNLLVDICELPLAAFDQMDGADYSALCNEMQPFLTGARKTSTT